MDLTLEKEIAHEEQVTMKVKIELFRGLAQINLKLDDGRVYMNLDEFDEVVRIVQQYRQALLVMEGTNVPD